MDLVSKCQSNEKFITWLNEHDKTCRYAHARAQGAIGGRLTFSVTPTNIGWVVKVRCACEAEVDLTDYDSW